jgi:hypothetical protein
MGFAIVFLCCICGLLLLCPKAGVCGNSGIGWPWQAEPGLE